MRRFAIIRRGSIRWPGWRWRSPCGRRRWCLTLAALLYFLPNGFMQSTVSMVSEAIDSFKSDPAAERDDRNRRSNAACRSGRAASAGAAAARSRLRRRRRHEHPAPAAADHAPAVASRRRGAGRRAPVRSQLRARAESWIEVKDGRDRVLLSRSLKPDETVMLDGVMPMRVKIGNAAVTELRYRGELIDLAPMTNENIARVQLK